MKILIATILLPYPLDSGGAQAQYNMIDGLRKKHTITLVYPENKHNSNAALQHLKVEWPEVQFKPFSYCAQYANLKFALSKLVRMFKILFFRNNNNFKVERILKPYGYDLTKRFVSFVNKAIKASEAELVQVEFYPYLNLVDFFPKNVKKVFVHHELRYIRNERMVEPLQLSARHKQYLDFLKTEEITELNKYDKVVTLTEQDKTILQSDGVTSPIIVSPAAVSTDVCPIKEWNGSIAFLGGAGHGPNEEGMAWLTNKVFPLIDWSSFEAPISFKIAGKGWEERHVKNFPTGQLQILGFVPDLSKEISGSILLVPILSGSGMRMKLLEGAAMGLPILTTTVGAEGLLFENGENCLKADTPKDFAECIRKLINDAELRSKLSVNAQSLYKNHYSKEALVEIRSKIYEGL